MRKATALIVAALFLLPLVTSAQWEFEHVMPADSNHTANTITHGLAVDGDGNLWTHSLFNWWQLIVDEDTMAVDPLWVMNPDGEVIDSVKYVMLADTLFPLQTGRGMRADHEGNILAAYGSNLFRINYQTGELMDHYAQPEGLPLTSPAVDALGNVYIGTVLAEAPVRILNADFETIDEAAIPQTGVSRTISVTQDGLTIFYCAPAENAVLKYSRDSEFDPWPEVPDTILHGMVPRSSKVNRVTGNLWVDAGDNRQPANQYEGVETNWEHYTWYEYDVEANEVVNSITWYNLENSFYAFRDGAFVNVHPDSAGAIGPEPRGGPAFSNDGTIGYFGQWAFGAHQLAQKWTTDPVSVRRDDRTIADDFTLHQNYPNPFNPATEIKFTLTEAGKTTLTIYDMLGREVETLVNEHMQPGSYTVTFDASNLPSGTYLYALESQGQRQVKKMVFLK